MIHVGPAGWSYTDWEGRVYPRKKPAGFHALRHLARYVDCVEVNSSFYATPRADWTRRWCELVAARPGFRFTAKLQGVFTHEPLPASDADLQRLVDPYLAGIEPLRAASALAAVLVQFPFAFRRSSAAERRLARLAECFGHLRLVVELRHRSWLEDAPLKRLAALGYSLCAIDLPHADDHPPRDVPQVGPLGYLRLHGRNASAWFDPRAGRDQKYDYLYSPDELQGVVSVAKRLASGRDETYVITNNHFSGQAVANALELLAALGDGPPLAPVELVDAYPRLRELTRPDGQPSLF